MLPAATASAPNSMERLRIKCLNLLVIIYISCSCCTADRDYRHIFFQTLTILLLRVFGGGRSEPGVPVERRMTSWVCTRSRLRVWSFLWVMPCRRISTARAPRSQIGTRTDDRGGSM